MSDCTYNQPDKNIVRTRVLTHAVKSLTSSRSSSPVVTTRQFEQMLKYSQQFIAQYGKVDISSYIAEQVDNWHSLHYSRVGRKKPEELNVLFLCGPNPSNDIQMLRDLGVSLHNIWAIEGDANAYEMAKKELIEVGLPVKLHRGSLQEFFAVVPQTFDIVYFDACGPLFGGKPNTIHVLRELFVNQRLTPLSALITNFSAANQDAQHPDMWSKRLASWYAARYEEPVAFDGEIFDRTQEINRYLQHINENLHEYYSDFISRFIIEFSSQLLPWWRVYALPAAKREYFAEPKLLDAAVKASMKLPNVEEIDLDNIFANFGHAQLSNNSYPLLWAAERTKEYLKPNDSMRDFFHNNPIRTGSLIDAIRATSLIRNFFESYVSWGKHNLDACSPEMANILRHFKWFDTEGQPWHRMFCDEPLPNLIADLLIGLYGYPYHVNLGKLLRFHYTAKVTPMYTDVFILDQARYLYDFQSSMSLFKLNSSLANQLIIRICIDAIGRHGYCGYPDLFRGSALASINEAGFTIYDWPERKSIQS